MIGDQQALRSALIDTSRALRQARRAAGLAENESASTLEAAERILEARRLRARFLPRELLGEPAWDLLLILFIARERQREIGISAAYREAGLADGTGFRWVENLIAAGLVSRSPSQKKRSATLLRLTDKGAEKMSLVLGSLN